MSITTETRANRLLNETIPQLEDELADDPSPERLDELEDAYRELLDLTEDLAARKAYEWGGVPDECKSRLYELEQLRSGNSPTESGAPETDDLDGDGSDEEIRTVDEKDDAGAVDEGTESSGDTSDEETGEDVFDIVEPDATFDDVVGLEEVKQDFREKVEAPFKDAETLDRLGIDPANGTVLYGPPGNGKTFICEATANELDAVVLKVKGSDILSKYVSEPEQNIDRLFAAARERAPCIVAFDEIDVFLKSRGEDDTSPGHDKMVGEFLAQTSELDAEDNVFIVGTTNQQEELDNAATRPGRLEGKTYVPLPDEPHRREMLREELADAEHSVRDTVIDRVAGETAWYSFADLGAIVNEAGWAAYRDDRDHITDTDLVNAYEASEPSVSKQTWFEEEREYRNSRGD
ncbi:ATP-binding protein [Halosimplex marinum]|uniref:ATP-binding protein n=1 Tax=Halosimplex marinum TaxID=3396620 RepID=UPI003F549B26